MYALKEVNLKVNMDHMLSGGHMHSNENETQWEHHMEDEHDDGDIHFGGFDMDHHTFFYSFRMMENDSVYYINFQGEKE